MKRDDNFSLFHTKRCKYKISCEPMDSVSKMSGFRCQFYKGSLMKVGSLPEIVQYGPSSSFVFLLLPKDLSIIFICYYCSMCCAVWRP